MIHLLDSLNIPYRKFLNILSVVNLRKSFLFKFPSLTPVSSSTQWCVVLSSRHVWSCEIELVLFLQIRHELSTFLRTYTTCQYHPDYYLPAKEVRFFWVVCCMQNNVLVHGEANFWSALYVYLEWGVVKECSCTCEENIIAAQGDHIIISYSFLAESTVLISNHSQCWLCTCSFLQFSKMASNLMALFSCHSRY